MELTIKDIQNFSFIKTLQESGDVFLVGGFVRDLMLDKKSKDVDLLVTKIPFEIMESTLKKFGRVSVTTVGDSFGVIKFIPKENKNIDFDIALPRTERKMTPEEFNSSNRNAHTAFIVNSDHNISIEEDLQRRDFTINAMAINLSNLELVDPFNGEFDLKHRKIKITHKDSFSDDPLRIFRAFQFASRFNFEIESSTWQRILDAVNFNLIHEIAGERILDEFKKVFFKRGNFKVFINNLNLSGTFEKLFNVNHSLNFEELEFREFGDFMFELLKDTKDLHHSFMKILKGDKETMKHIKAVKLAQLNVQDNAPENRMVVFRINKLSKSVRNSKLLPKSIRIEFDLMLKGKFPLTFKELSISGNDLIKENIEPMKRGKALIDSLSATFHGTPNKKEELLTLLK